MKNQYITKNTKIALITSTLLILLLFFTGTGYKLFEKFSWYDELAHLVGGVWVGLIIVSTYKKYKNKIPFYNYFKKAPLKTILILMLAVAIGWEIFEAVLVKALKTAYGTAPDLQSSHFDTFTDSITALLGAAFSTLFDK